MSYAPSTDATCPHCGFSPLHTKSVVYSAHVVVTHRCAICLHQFDTEHQTRDAAELRIVGDGAWHVGLRT